MSVVGLNAFSVLKGAQHPQVYSRDLFRDGLRMASMIQSFSLWPTKASRQWSRNISRTSQQCSCHMHSKCILVTIHTPLNLSMDRKMLDSSCLFIQQLKHKVQ